MKTIFAWRVLIGEQDGLGGSREKAVWFEEYDDAHDYYTYIKSQKGEPFHSFIIGVPANREISSVYAKGEWKIPE